MEISERISQLRKLMAEKGIDIYYIPNEDDHLSEEYTADYFKCKSFISGFTGDAGCVIVTPDFAGLWTDGRFFTQAEDELAGTCVTLMRLRQEGVPNPVDFLADHTPENGVLGFDGRVVSAQSAMRLSARLKKKNAKLHVSDDLAGEVWGSKRPEMPQEKVYVLAEKYTGESASDKIGRIRKVMKEKEADALVLTALEDPCWLYNIRGNDIECTPVAYAFAMVTESGAYYYIDNSKLTDDVRQHFAAHGITVKEYAEIASDLKEMHGKMIWADPGHLNSVLYTAVPDDNRLISEASPVEKMRAVKNAVETGNIRNAHLKDGTAMVRFLKWVKENASSGTMTEVTAQDHLYALRAAEEDYIEPSFPTISAYQENGAMMHYCATEEKHAAVKPRGFLLVDSGGTYFDGTTDITRTISLGGLTDEEKMYYTLVLKGHIALSHAKFLYGTTGQNLDILARGPLWNLDIDYQCGTGHGVGHVLSVHEGPHSISWGLPRQGRTAAVLEPGMIVTDEPGVYFPRRFGIRIENELLVREHKKNFYGQFLCFEDITYCPYDLDAVDTAYLTDEEIGWINEYHRNVYEKIAPRLNEEEREWLKEATRELKRV